MPCYQIKLQILILAEQSLENSIVHSDSRSLATLLLIRDIQVTYPKSYVPFQLFFFSSI